MDIIAVWLTFWRYVTDRWVARHFFKAIGAVVGFLLGCVALIGLFWVIVYGFAVLIANFWPVLAVIVGIPAFLVFKYIEHKGKATPPEVAPMPQPAKIELTRARADGIYPLVKQSEYILITGLTQYLPGLMKPFSLSAIEAPVHYNITAAYITIFSFIVSKGEGEAPVSTIQEIVDSLIAQHLRAQDLPLTIPATYTNEAGETFPGLVCDGTFDCGSFLRLDLVITNEAETVRLKARAVAKLEGRQAGGPSIHDADFD